MEKNMSNTYLFTSESVSDGHPDKVADQISDAVLDWVLEKDCNAKVACETLIAPSLVVVAGEFKSRVVPTLVAELHSAIPELVRQVIRAIGYSDATTGFDLANCEIKTSINSQSDDINQGVDQAGGEIGAGDQGLMFGFACRETPELMPLPIALAHRLMARQGDLRRGGALPWLRPDAKSQVTVRYDGSKPVCVEKVVLSTQHAAGISTEEVRHEVIRQIIEPVIPKKLRAPGIQYLVNPTGRFEVGGPQGDTGLTGRKIIVDTYGGSCPHGGGAFSGKDPTKVDRSAAYMARYIAKNVVAAQLAERCTIQLAYAIGTPEPVSVHIDLHGTGNMNTTDLEKAIRVVFGLTPKGLIEMLDLRQPIYRQTAAYGHFGREQPEFTWERPDRASLLSTVAHNIAAEASTYAAKHSNDESELELRYRTFACWAARRAWQHAGVQGSGQVTLAVQQYLYGEKTFAEVKVFQKTRIDGATGAGIIGVSRCIPSALAQLADLHSADDNARVAASRVMHHAISTAAYAAVDRALEAGTIVLPTDEARSGYRIASAIARYPEIGRAARDQEKQFLLEKLTECLVAEEIPEAVVTYG
jgi:S-adenosylmethionine synthetase